MPTTFNSLEENAFIGILKICLHFVHVVISNCLTRMVSIISIYTPTSPQLSVTSFVCEDSVWQENGAMTLIKTHPVAHREAG